MLGLFFTSTDETNYAEVDLKPGGANIVVGDSNKTEFVKLKCHYHAYLSCKRQLEKIREGFYEVIPAAWVRFLDVDELETFMCGLQTIELSDWKAHTELRGFNKYINSITVYRFWQIMATYDQT